MHRAHGSFHGEDMRTGSPFLPPGDMPMPLPHVRPLSLDTSPLRCSQVADSNGGLAAATRESQLAHEYVIDVEQGGAYDVPMGPDRGGSWDQGMGFQPHAPLHADSGWYDSGADAGPMGPSSRAHGDFCDMYVC